jgi:hypothetical protein
MAHGSGPALTTSINPPVARIFPREAMSKRQNTYPGNSGSESVQGEENVVLLRFQLGTNTLFMTRSYVKGIPRSWGEAGHKSTSWPDRCRNQSSGIRVTFLVLLLVGTRFTSGRLNSV